MYWTHSFFLQLERHELYALLKLRAQVFVVEQQCVFLDPDGLDAQDNALHVLGKNEHGGLVAYARLLLPAQVHQEVLVSRVVTSDAVRGNGVGHALMTEVMRLCRHYCPDVAITLAAQNHLRSFYAHHGFSVCGGVYVEDGIEHIQMIYTPHDLQK